MVTISQSGSAADALAALKQVRSMGMGQTLTICNVSTIAMVRKCKLICITRAGVEIGASSNKGFSTQLAGLYLLTLVLQAMLALEPQVMVWAGDDTRIVNKPGVHLIRMPEPFGTLRPFASGLAKM